MWLWSMDEVHACFKGKLKMPFTIAGCDQEAASTQRDVVGQVVLRVGATASRRQLPGFADALATKSITLNKNIAPFDIYPVVIEGSVTYTFSLPRRKF